MVIKILNNFYIDIKFCIYNLVEKKINLVVKFEKNMH